MEIRCEVCGKTFNSDEALAHHTQAKHSGKEETNRRGIKIRKSYIIAIIVLLIIAGLVVTMISSEEAKYTLSATEHEHFKGNPDASVTVVEFSDFQCPFCGRFYKNTLPQIEEEYIKTGKIKFVYRHFPIASHSYAQKAAEAAECAADIAGESAFWQLHDKMFENNAFLSITNIKKFAREIGLNESFDLCLDSGAMRNRVLEDFQEGQQLGVRGTPAFFVNGELISGAQPFSVFKVVIDRKLAEHT